MQNGKASEQKRGVKVSEKRKKEKIEWWPFSCNMHNIHRETMNQQTRSLTFLKMMLLHRQCL